MLKFKLNEKKKKNIKKSAKLHKITIMQMSDQFALKKNELAHNTLIFEAKIKQIKTKIIR